MAEEKTEVDVLCEKLFMNKKHSANFVDEAELQKAMEVFCASLKLAALEKLLA